MGKNADRNARMAARRAADAKKAAAAFEAGRRVIPKGYGHGGENKGGGNR